MSVYTTCNHRYIDDGFIQCESVCLLSGEVCSVYLGPCGVYVVVDGLCVTARELYISFRDLLETTNIRLYVIDSGLYDPGGNCFDSSFDEDDLETDINAWLSDRYPIYKESVLEHMAACLELEDAKARGHRLSEDGTLFLYRRGQFYPASPFDSEVAYFLTLFGGTLGFHRFVQGKWFTGLIYLFTCGMFMTGWFLDSLFLLLGIQRDKQGRYFAPLSGRFKKYLLFPVGFAVSMFVFVIYFSLASRIMLSAQEGIAQRVYSTDPQLFQSFFDIISNLPQ